MPAKAVQIIVIVLRKPIKCVPGNFNNGKTSHLFTQKNSDLKKNVSISYKHHVLAVTFIYSTFGNCSRIHSFH